jgi:hypothetical protein
VAEVELELLDWGPVLPASARPSASIAQRTSEALVTVVVASVNAEDLFGFDEHHVQLRRLSKVP